MKLRNLKRKKNRTKAATQVKKHLYANQGYDFFENGLLEDAIKSFLKLLKISPQDDQVLHTLGVIYMKKSDPEIASTYFNKSIHYNSSIPGYYYNLGNSYAKLGQLKEIPDEFNKLMELAVQSYKKALELNPKYLDALSNLANAFFELNKFKDAIAVFEKLDTFSPETPRTLFKIGLNYQKLKNERKAIEYFDRALLINPDLSNALTAKALSLITLGEFSEAKTILKKSFAIDSSDVNTLCYLSKITKYESTNHSEIDYLKKFVLDNSTSEIDKSRVYFALGKIHNDCKMFEEAFRYYEKGNNIKHQYINRRGIDPSSLCNRAAEIFSSSFWEHADRSTNESKLPVFVVGMPRSGTSLIEQILASHSEIYGAGELDTIKELGKKNTSIPPFYFDNIQNLSVSDLNTFGSDYIASLTTDQDSKGIRRIIDKMPSNYKFLGLVGILFPKAKIIHCRRNPLDTCISNFFQNYQMANQFSYDFSDLAKEYITYHKLMNHWRDTLPINIYDVAYENLVVDFENESKKLINYLGLEWEENCLNYSETKNAVHTASSWQVRQPIYNSSRNRWHNYDKYLGSLKDNLKDLIEEYEEKVIKSVI